MIDSITQERKNINQPTFVAIIVQIHIFQCSIAQSCGSLQQFAPAPILMHYWCRDIGSLDRPRSKFVQLLYCTKN